MIKVEITKIFIEKDEGYPIKYEDFRDKPTEPIKCI